MGMIGRTAQELPVIVLVDEPEKHRLVPARVLAIRNWVTKEKLPPPRLADEVRNDLAFASKPGKHFVTQSLALGN
jgi:hypothetical protein